MRSNRSCPILEYDGSPSPPEGTTSEGHVAKHDLPAGADASKSACCARQRVLGTVTPLRIHGFWWRLGLDFTGQHDSQSIRRIDFSALRLLPYFPCVA